VRIDLTLPGQELAVNRVQHEDAYVAVRDAFDDLRRQVQEGLRRLQAHPQHHRAETPPPAATPV
jgi:ribosome-associated translation inhibitor RaiA